MSEREALLQEAYISIESAVKTLCELSQWPHDKADVTAQKIAQTGDKIGAALAEQPEPELEARPGD
jgi:hypothetical protein